MLPLHRRISHRFIATFCFVVAQEFEDGQILIEYEPIRYELRDIVIDKWRKHIVRNVTVLGETTLSNSEDYSNSVETAIGYVYDQVLYWGTYEGVARGLPTTIYEKNEAPVNLENGWGLREVHKREEVNFCTNDTHSIFMLVFIVFTLHVHVAVCECARYP